MSQLRRGLKVLHYLQQVGASSFGELLSFLAPISRTTLSTLLRELELVGELEHVGRVYRPLRRGEAGAQMGLYQLPEEVHEEVQAILSRTAEEAGHACALFARVGGTTMKIVGQYNLGVPHWSFSPVGHEWPLVPFHGFSKVFLAYDSADVADGTYKRWVSYLRPELLAESLEMYRRQLEQVREKGYALEYKEELSTILRIAMPVFVNGEPDLRFVVGIVARSIYLLELEKCIAVLSSAVDELSQLL